MTEPDRNVRVLREGAIAGVLGYAAVAAAFALWNLAAGRSPFHTAAVLGAVLFRNLRPPDPILLDAPTILAYNAVHLVVGLLLGITVAALLAESTRGMLRRAVGLLLVAGFVGSVAGVGMLTVEIARVLDWASVIGANTIGALATVGYLLARRTA